MTYEITPKGTATGVGWEYQLERDGHFSSWIPYPQTFVHDPEDGLDIRTNVVYWLYARNLNFPDADVPAAPIRVESDGRVVSLDSEAEKCGCGTKSSLAGLVAASTQSQLNAFLAALLASADSNAKALFCQLVSSCGIVTNPQTISYAFRNFAHYEFVSDVPEETPKIARIDTNNCQRITGWIHGGKARVERDGVVVAYIDADIPREQAVIDFLATQGITATSIVLGFAYYKTAAESAGTHTWRVFVGSSNVEATSDTGQSTLVTCTNPNPSNPAPQLVNPTPDWTITAFNGTAKVLAANQFSDNAGDTGELRAYYYNEQLKSYMNLPSWLVFDPATRTFTQPPAGTPNQTLTIRVVYVDSANQSADDEFDLIINVTTQTPTTVGSAAINIVMANVAECSVKLVTPGFSETNAEAFAVADNTRRFIGGNDVDNSLALGSSGYTTTSGVGYYSFAFGINLFRSRYPSATTAVFDVFVHPNSAITRIVNRLNSSYQISSGIQKKTLSNGFDYEYANPQSAISEFWGYDAGSGNGQRNTASDLHAAFTIDGGVKKKIGAVTINLSTGATQFQPI